MLNKLQFPQPHTYRSKKYLSFIREKPCLICGDPNTVPHHEGLGLNMMGGKSPDSHAVPLCALCHRRYHDTGPAFWDARAIDIKMVIIKLVTEYLQQIEYIEQIEQ